MRHVPDINVLLAAARSDHTQHAPALAWLESTLTAAQTNACSISIPLVVAAGFIRLITNKRLFAEPATTQQAIDFIDQLAALNNVHVADTPNAWLTFRMLLLDKSAAGNAVPDAWLASHTVAVSGVLTTFDKNFQHLLAPHYLNWLNAPQRS